MDKKSKIFLSVLSFAAFVLLQGVTQANQYKALCIGDENCNISIDSQGISGPQGFIRSGAVIQWYQGGEGDSINIGTAVAGAVVGGTAGAIAGGIAGGIATCWTLVLCAPGILTGLVAGGSGGSLGGSKFGNNSDHIFTILGYNNKGNKIIQSFRFINKKPARKVAMQLPAITGLAVGQVRSLKNIANSLGIELQDDISEAILPAEMPAKIGPETEEAKPNQKCWSNYLENNPAMKKWSEANPLMAEQTKKRYDDC